MIVQVVLLVLAALWLVQYLATKVKVISMLADVSGPSYPLPLIGHLMHILPTDSVLERGIRLMENYGPGPVKFWVGEWPSVTVTQPEDIEPVLSSKTEVEKPDIVYKPVRGFFGAGLITLNDDAWLKHRRALNPAFHFSILERYTGIFTRRANAFADMLLAEVPAGKTVDIMKFLSALVSETITETAFGMPPACASKSGQRMDMAEFVRASEEAFSVIAYRILHPWLLIDAIFKLSHSGRVNQRSEDIIKRYAKRVIAEKKQQIQERRAAGADDSSVPEDPDDDDDGVRKKYTFLDMALGGKSDVLSDAEILEEVRTLIAAQPTSASTLSFVMVMLAFHPDVQERVRAEVRGVDVIEGLPPLDRLKQLRYIERVIKETLRLYPITAFFSRKLKEELRLPTCTLPKGVLANMFTYMTHRDPRHWPDPERFDPDRFLPENCVGRHAYAYLPFSAGPRSCIGQRYAMLQMKAVVAAVVARCVVLPGKGLETRDKIRLGSDLFLNIKGGFNVCLRPVSAE